MLVKAFQILLAFAVVMLIYYIVPWVLQMIGLSIPEHIWRIILVILCLMAVIGVLTGKYKWWETP